MTAKSKLALRRVKNRKQLKLKRFKQAWEKTYTGFESVPLKIYVDGKPIDDNAQIFLNPNEDRFWLSDEEKNNMFKVHDNVTY